MNRTAALIASSLLSCAAYAENFSGGSKDDPSVREAAFLAADHRYLSALSELEAIRPAAPTVDFTRSEADSALDFGLVEKSETLTANLPMSASENAAYQLRLAQFDYERGRYDKADARLAAAHDASSANAGVWVSLKGLVLLGQGRASEAASVLASSQTPLDRYNLGVAELAEGKPVEGRQTLEKLGRMDVLDPESGALRDKANLVLGYAFLNDGTGKLAVPLFERIHSLGPYTNKALLGMGWAQLAPDQAGNAPSDSSATAASPGPSADKSAHNGALLDLEPGKGTPAQQAQFKRALVPWLELISRDPLDPAVQECTLAIPFALERLGAFTQAQDYYHRAIDGLQKARATMDESMSRVSDGKMIAAIVRPSANNDAESGWTWQLKSLPDTPETFYLQSLLAENRFQEALKQYRDVLLLSSTLDDWQKKLDDLKSNSSAAPHELASLQARIADLRPQLASASAQARSQVEALALTELKQQKDLTDRYLVEARLALARIYDRRLGAASP